MNSKENKQYTEGYVYVYDTTERDPIRYIVMWWTLNVLLPIPRPATNPEICRGRFTLDRFFFFFSFWQKLAGRYTLYQWYFEKQDKGLKKKKKNCQYSKEPIYIGYRLDEIFFNLNRTEKVNIRLLLRKRNTWK